MNHAAQLTSDLVNPDYKMFKSQDGEDPEHATFVMSKTPTNTVITCFNRVLACLQEYVDTGTYQVLKTDFVPMTDGTVAAVVEELLLVVVEYETSEPRNISIILAEDAASITLH